MDKTKIPNGQNKNPKKREVARLPKFVVQDLNFGNRNFIQ